MKIRLNLGLNTSIAPITTTTKCQTKLKQLYPSNEKWKSQTRIESQKREMKCLNENFTNEKLQTRNESLKQEMKV